MGDSHIPLSIVLTGGIASGKSAASNEFERLGAPVIDTDCIAREIVEPGKPALAEIETEFGSDFILSDGHLDRARMRKEIFLNPAAKRRLEAILHPKIGREVLHRLHAISGPYCIIVIPLFAESSNYGWVDRVLVVDVPESVQFQRLMARDNINRAQAQAIIRAQASRQERLALADDVIDNNGRIEDLQRQVEILHRKYVQLATAD